MYPKLLPQSLVPLLGHVYTQGVFHRGVDDVVIEIIYLNSIQAVMISRPQGILGYEDRKVGLLKERGCSSQR